MLPAPLGGYFFYALRLRLGHLLQSAWLLAVRFSGLSRTRSCQRRPAISFFIHSRPSVKAFFPMGFRQLPKAQNLCMRSGNVLGQG